MNTILFATDGSPSSHKALGEAIELAKHTGWQLRILTVWRTPILTGYGYTPVVYVPELAQDEKEHANEVARTAVAIADEAGVRATCEVRQGDAATEILDAAAESGVRLIVLGAHGWGAFKRLLSGSVSTHVMHEATCPVLVVRMSPAELEAASPEEAAVA